MTAQLHHIAQKDTPSTVEVPNTMAGLVVWALTRFGLASLGFLFLVPVYLDLRSSNERFAKIIEANVQVITSINGQMLEQTRRLERIEDALRDRQP